MANIILTGSKMSAKNYIDGYIKDHKFKEYDVTYFHDKIKIEDARAIRKSLVAKSNNQRVFVLSGNFTHESQNALLKSIEESSDSVHFIFCVEKKEDLLETVRSRCSIVSLPSDLQLDRELLEIVRNLRKSGPLFWDEIDTLSEYAKNNTIEPIILVLRTLILENLDKKQEVSNYHNYCKRLLSLSSLSSNNNVSERIILESVFF
ncbi:MAG: hypothetical protein Q7T54_06335 [Candidatus Levybacteria bacterium]|nr:hypothetical protein [Candidatus Levybacteria bacterium]